MYIFLDLQYQPTRQSVMVECRAERLSMADDTLGKASVLATVFACCKHALELVSVYRKSLE